MAIGADDVGVVEDLRSTRDLEILARVGRSLLQGIEISEQLDLTLDLAAGALEADRGSVMLGEPSSGDLVVACARGLPDRAATHALPDGIAVWVATNNQPLILHGEVADPRFKGVDPSITSALSLPLSSSGRVLGVLNLNRSTGSRFTDEDLRLATSLADLAALAVEKAALHEALRERESKISNLLAALLDAQEQERRRISADIHDGFLQDLTALHLMAEGAKTDAASGYTERASKKVDEVQAMIRTLMDRLRRFTFEVRPLSLDEVGLAPTLKQMVESAAAAGGLDGHFDSSLDGRLPQQAESVLYRVAQEALRNTVAHAGAGHVWVSLSLSDRQARLTVADDGRGMDQPAKPGHFGVESMRQRVELAGGRFLIGPGPGGSGTLVKASVPVEA